MLFVKIIVEGDLNKSLILSITLQHVRHPAPYASFDASNHLKNAVTFLFDDAYNIYLVIKQTKISYRLRGNFPKIP